MFGEAYPRSEGILAEQGTCHAIYQRLPGKKSPAGEDPSAESPAGALSGADIVCTATTSGTPVFSDPDLEKGVHINAVGAYLPNMAEIPPKTVGRARVYVGSRAAAFSEAGDLILPLREGIIKEEHVLGELGELFLGTIPGREHPEEVTLFKSVGIAVQDAAAAWECYRNAVRLGIGTDIEW
jgi:ornithine cyclodeaminase/alanine dehydrogenase-like protein (mu-crystallin family)